MRIRILMVGKMREPYFKEGFADYAKRTSPYARLELVEIRAEPDSNSPSLQNAAVAVEADRIKKVLFPAEGVIAMDMKGSMLTSEEFSLMLKWFMDSGKPDLAFVVGGSRGLSSEILKVSDRVLSLGRMTYPHQMVPLILAEQIYRAFKIMSGDPYHK